MEHWAQIIGTHIYHLLNIVNHHEEIQQVRIVFTSIFKNLYPLTETDGASESTIENSHWERAMKYGREKFISWFFGGPKAAEWRLSCEGQDWPILNPRLAYSNMKCEKGAGEGSIFVKYNFVFHIF